MKSGPQLGGGGANEAGAGGDRDNTYHEQGAPAAADSIVAAETILRAAIKTTQNARCRVATALIHEAASLTTNYKATSPENFPSMALPAPRRGPS